MRVGYILTQKFCLKPVIGSFHLKFSAQKQISLKLGILIAFREYTEPVGEKKNFENSKKKFSKISPLSAKINGTNFSICCRHSRDMCYSSKYLSINHLFAFFCFCQKRILVALGSKIQKSKKMICEHVTIVNWSKIVVKRVLNTKTKLTIFKYYR